MRFLKLYLIGQPKFEVKDWSYFWFCLRLSLVEVCLFKTGDLRKCLKLDLKNTHTTWMLYWNILQCLMGDSKGMQTLHHMRCYVQEMRDLSCLWGMVSISHNSSLFWTLGFVYFISNLFIPRGELIYVIID